ncbi:toll/interleukin-1 receptor domain-containing protein [Ruminococcus sp. CLA-AA-H200]|uniref:Toll/interleukin-1 receptor domain-containing protein n=1 Tax=Ruminococcus turbiniformis TaxID=2881258 RepID=A0ABS8FXA9_9FIRM|nr:tetratricopeptide repeat protein [Ruminococcus turbiniformis]MCC2254688.1 toll/interleukin-1 receptor domain-containing protein [Ruminococcus turbiniformis]
MHRDVFISYHRNSSAELVENIVSALEERGIRCWYAPRDVESKYAGDIVRAIEDCQIFLLIMNEYSTHSEHVLNEINYAFNRFHQKENIRLLPFRTDKNELSDDVKYYLGRIHCLDGSEPPEEDRIEALISRISYWLQSGDRDDVERGDGHGEERNLSSGEEAFPAVRNIRSTSLVHNTNFVGRTEEIEEIYKLLHTGNNKLFLSGPGGIGKSELSRQYALKFGGEYKTIVWFTYNTGIEDMVVSDQFLFIRGLENENQDLTTPEAREACYFKKMNYLKDHCGRDTLLIVDNFDSEDERLDEFLAGEYSVIFSTRISREKEGYQELAIRPFNRREDQLALFQKFYKRPLRDGEEEILFRLFEKIGFHTYGIELLAKQMQASRTSPENMLDYFEGKSAPSGKRSRLVMEHIMDVMTQIFRLSNLSDEKFSILKNMVLLPVEGIDTELFFDLTELEDFMLIDELIDSSFIQYNYITDVISLHPLIANTICRTCPDFAAECQIYIRNLTERLSSFTHFKYSEKQILLSLAENYYLKWCDPKASGSIPFMERLAEAYAEYFMRDKSIAIMERLLTLDPDPIRASWYHYYISNQRRCLGQYEELSKEAARSLEIIEKVPESPEMRQQLSLSYSMMGWAKYHENRLEESADYFEKSLQLRREILPDSDVLIAWAYYNSASVLCRTEEIQKAVQYYEEAIRRFLLIDETGICVPAYIGIAEAYLSQGDCGKAEEALEQAFTCEYEYYGEENCRKYWLYEVKSKILEKQGKKEQAEEYARLSKEEYAKMVSV